MQALRMRSSGLWATWWMAGLIGLTGGMLLVLAVGVGTGVTQFSRHSTQAVVASHPAVDAPANMDLVVPNNYNLGSGQPATDGSIFEGGTQPNSVTGGRMDGITSVNSASQPTMGPRSTAGSALPDGCYVQYQEGIGLGGSEAAVGISCVDSELPASSLTGR